MTSFFLQLVLSNMVAVSFVLSGNSGTTERVFLDKSLVGKFSAEMVSDGEKYLGFYVCICTCILPMLKL